MDPKGQIRIDFHTHTWASRDARNRPRHFQKCGRVEGFAITDHDSVAALKVIQQEVHGKLIIPGCEIRTPEVEILALFYEEDEIPRGTLAEILDTLRSTDSLVAVPHPNRVHKDVDALMKKADAIEAFNGHSTRHQNVKAREMAVNSGLSLIAGSDAHYPFQRGRFYGLVPYTEELEDIRKAILHHEVVVPEFRITRVYGLMTMIGNWFTRPTIKPAKIASKTVETIGTPRR